MKKLRKSYKSYEQSLIIILILFCADIFSFATVKAFSQVYKEPPIYIPISFKVTVVEEQKHEIDDSHTEIKVRNKNKNKSIKDFINKKNLISKRVSDKISSFKETSENLVLDIMPIVLIGCIILARNKDFFELKYSY